MAVATDKVIVELQAKLDKYNANIAAAQRGFDGAMSKIQRSATNAEKRIAASASGMSSSLIKAFGVIGGARTFQTLIDSATRIDNALKVAGLSGQELERVYARLRDSAMRNAAPLETLVTLYGRASLVQKELNVSQEEMLNFTDKIALALRVSGQSAAESSGALLQLSQALGSGVVRAEEFNSILEGALPIAQAAAKGLKEAGGSVAKLRQLVVDGKVSSEAFFRAFEAGAYTLEEKVAGATLTTEQGFTNLSTALVDAMREFAKGSLAAETLGEALGTMASYINSLDFESFGAQVRALVEYVRNAASQVGGFMQYLNSVGANFGAATGADAIGDWLTGGKAYQEFAGGALKITNQRGVQRRIDAAFEETVVNYGKTTEDEIRSWYEGRSTISLPSIAPTPSSRPSASGGTVSLDDFDPPSRPGGGGRKGGRKGAGGRADDYKRLSERIKESTAALNAETEALSQVNPLVKDYGFASEKARAEQELLAAAQKAGMAVTPELRQNIDMLATAYANAEANAAKLRERQDQIAEASDFLKETLADSFMELVPAIETGNKALDKFLNTLIEATAQALLLGKGPLAALFGGSGGGLLSLFGFAQGGIAAYGKPMQTYARGGVAKTASIFGEAGPEAAVPLPDGRSIPVDLRTNGASSSQQNVHVTVGVDVDGSGNLMPFVQFVSQSSAEQSTASLARRVPKMVDNRVNVRQTRKTRPL